uniref:Carboxylesterase type B domain-containing protein n=1 Tax=Timema tahoe TaxID=61484 RepID=A0A7R9IU64_9NEOP|nr:unnamed protein product [Timema tahoe]
MRPPKWSGSAINPWAFHLNTQPYAFNLGAKLGLNTTDGQELATFLRAQQVEDLVNNLDGIVPETEDVHPIYQAFVPTTEYPTSGEETFLPLNPYTMLITGNFNKVPYITGSNLLEAAGFVGNDICEFIKGAICPHFLILFWLAAPAHM